MDEYEPLDLAPWCNAGPEWLLPGETIPSGVEALRGIPFRFGPGARASGYYPAFGPGGHTEARRLPIGRQIHWVIFAHRLAESRLPEGEPVGRVVATYRFEYDDGTEIPISIRERLEIAMVPLAWGQLPFLAVPDERDFCLPRAEGPWEKGGYRLAEVEQPYPLRFVLWAWKNPRPEQMLSSLTVIPMDRKFILAAVTISDLEEEPFALHSTRPLKITFGEPQPPVRPEELDLRVDRGVVGYPYPLPADGAEGFLRSVQPGWGHAYPGSSRRFYVDIAAQPSATVRLASGAGEIAEARWRDLLAQAETPRGSARLQVVDPELNWVHVQVQDDATGKPVPCRIHFRNADGIPYQPYGHHNHLLSDQDTWHIDIGGDVRLGQVTYAYIDGTCQGWLPQGEVLVDVARGYEYEPLRTRVFIQRGQRDLGLRLKRWANLNQEGWYSGDTHVHFLSTSGAHLEAQGEDLNVVNLLQSQWGHLFTNTEDFLGRPAPSPDGRTIVYTSQENRQHILGHLGLLGLRSPVFPWCSDGPGEAELSGPLETTLCHWADHCHAQGGTVIASHMPNPNGEMAALIATDRVDAVEMLWFGQYEHVEYYRYLNGGYRLPLVGGTDKMTASVPVGTYRTYVWLPPTEQFTYENWCAGLRKGRTFLSAGPILRFTVDGACIGDTVQVNHPGATLEVEAEAESIFPIHCLQVVEAGRVIASTEEANGSRRLRLRATVKVDKNTWLAARVAGPGYAPALLHHDVWQRGVMAHTSPIYVAVDPVWSMRDPETAQYMLTLIQASLDYVARRCAHEPLGRRTHAHGEEDHLGYLQRPLREALEAVKTRVG